jgi:molybdopterin synthase catalytic subunit
MHQISVQAEPFDPEAEQAALRRDNPAVGALVAFVGLMRDLSEGGRVTGMHLEHYPGMTENALAGIVAEAQERWALEAVRLIHRVGALRPLDPIVLVAVASRHRGDAFRACEFIIDYLKTRAPFWKKERGEGGERWVEARASDLDAERRWRPPGGGPTTTEDPGRE